MSKLLKVIAAVGFVAIIAFVGLYLYVNRPDTFEDQIKKCNTVSPELRFSCYRSVIEKNYKGKTEEFSKKLKEDHKLASQRPPYDAGNDNVTYAIFGTNCHTFYHAAGDFIATYEKDKSVSEKLAMGVPSCTSGYMMGIFKRTALQNGFSIKILKELFGACGKFGTHQCAHEIGHLLHDKYTYSVLKILDDTSKREYGLTYPDKYRYLVAKTNDLNAPFEECKKILPPFELNYCYSGIGHNLFVFAEFSPGGFKQLFNECDHVKPENKKNCHGFVLYRIGQNEAAPKIISGKFKEGLKACEDAIKLSGADDIREHCMIGIGGGLGLYADTEFSGFVATKNNISWAQKNMHKLINYCKMLPEGDINDCIAGLFGTPFRKLYVKFQIHDERVDAIFDKLDSDFQVVG